MIYDLPAPYNPDHFGDLPGSQEFRGNNRESWMQGHMNECPECFGSGFTSEMIGNTVSTNPCSHCQGAGYTMEQANDK